MDPGDLLFRLPRPSRVREPTVSELSGSCHLYSFIFIHDFWMVVIPVICSWFLMNYCVLLLMGAKGFSECCARGLCQRRSMELCHEDVWCNASECLATGWATWKISELETRLLENAKMLPDAFAAVEVWGSVMTWGLPTAMCCRNPGKVLLEHWQCCSLGAPKPTWTLLQMLIAVLSRTSSHLVTPLATRRSVIEYIESLHVLRICCSATTASCSKSQFWQLLSRSNGAWWNILEQCRCHRCRS